MPVDASAGVLAFDDIVVKGTTVMLRAETKGKLFKEGGKIVEFEINGESIGRSLSGGDAIAYKEFFVKKSGLIQIKVISETEEDIGYVLSVKKGESIIFIHVEGALFESVLSKKPSEGSLEAIDRIADKFHVAYLSSLPTGTEYLKRRLRDIGFSKAPLIKFNDGRAFSEIVNKGLRIKAVIGDSEVVSAAMDYGAEAISFREVEGAREVGGWKEIEEILFKDNN